MADTAFHIMFTASIVYVLLGNYLYLAKVLPALGEPPKLLPSSQLKDVDRYLELVDGQQNEQWFVPLLRNVRAINAVYVIGFAVTVTLILTD